MHFCFLPLDGVKLFPTEGICLLRTASSSSTQISKTHRGTLQTNEVLSCKSVIILWSVEGVIVQAVTRLRFSRVCWCFSPLMAEVTVRVFRLCAQWSAQQEPQNRQTLLSQLHQGMRIVAFFQSILLVCLGTCMQWFMDWGLWVVMWCGHRANEGG